MSQAGWSRMAQDFITLRACSQFETHLMIYFWSFPFNVFRPGLDLGTWGRGARARGKTLLERASLRWCGLPGRVCHHLVLLPLAVMCLRVPWALLSFLSLGLGVWLQGALTSFSFKFLLLGFTKPLECVCLHFSSDFQDFSHDIFGFQRHTQPAWSCLRAHRFFKISVLTHNSVN